MRKTYYVAGPMRGVPKFNYPLFDEVAAALHRRGHNVINPADLDRRINPDVETADGFLSGDFDQWQTALGESFHKVIGQDFIHIVTAADGLVMLPGWEKSTGANHEKYVGEATGKQILYAHKSPQGHWLFLPENPDRVRQLEVVPYGPSAVQDDDYPEPEAQSTVIGLMGYAQVGKDTLAAELVRDYGFERIAFADALREVLYALNPLIHFSDMELGSDMVTKASTDGGRTVNLQWLIDAIGWDNAKVDYPEVRELLQRMGTEAGREILGNDIWVETALRKVKPGGKYVITDVRFPNEFAAVQKMGQLLRIVRDGYGPVNNHFSETALDGYEADHVIINDGTPADLVYRAAWRLGLEKTVRA